MTSSAWPARSFEDGKLISLIWSEECVVLGLLHPDGARFDLVIKGVRALRVDGLRESNFSIVDLWIVSGREPTDLELSGSSLAALAAVLYPAPSQEKARVHREHVSFVKGEIQSLVNGEATLLILGCLPSMDLTALSASIELRGPL
jgi:hypothetical protein